MSLRLLLPRNVSEYRDTSLPHTSDREPPPPKNDGIHSSRRHQEQRTPRDPANQGKTCDVCGQAFRWAQDRRRHEKSHLSGEFKFVCDGGCGKTGCGKTYSRRDVLLRHLISSRSNQDGTSLARHEICHTGEGLKCPYCSLRPSTTSGLAEHLRSHINARPFACAICSRAYKYKRDLQKHTKRCLPPAQLLHQQNMAQNTPVASDTESFPVYQGDDLVSTVGTHNDHVDTDNHSDGLISYPPMATEGFLIQHPPMPTAPIDGINQDFYGDSLPIETWPVGAFFCTSLWGEPCLAPPVSVVTQQGMAAGQQEDQAGGHLGTLDLNTSGRWIQQDVTKGIYTGQAFGSKN